MSPIPASRRFTILLVVLTLSLVVRAAILVRADQALLFEHDSASYINSARALLETGTFSIAPNQLEPQTIRTPGYPLFLAMLFGLFGENWIAILFVQMCFSVATIGLVYGFGSKLWNPDLALLASVLLALDLNSLGFSLLVLTEALFTFFLTAFVFVLAMVLQRGPLGERQGWKSAMLAGLLLAVATHMRPISYYLVIPVIVVWFVWGWIQKWDRRVLVTNLLAFLIPFLILVGGWQVRNYMQTGSSQFSAIESINMVNYRAAMVIAERDGISRDEAVQQIKDQYGLTQQRGWNEAWRSAGVDVLLHNPDIFLKQYAVSLANIFIGPGSEIAVRLSGVDVGESGPLGDLRRLSPGEYVERWVVGDPLYFFTFIFSMMHMLLLYAGAAYWSVRTLFQRPWNVVSIFLFGMLAYLALVSAGPEAYYRFRVPMTPLLVLMTAGAWFDFMKRRRSVSKIATSRSNS